jgi:hypothetical protein
MTQRNSCRPCPTLHAIALPRNFIARPPFRGIIPPLLSMRAAPSSPGIHVNDSGVPSDSVSPSPAFKWLTRPLSLQGRLLSVCFREFACLLSSSIPRRRTLEAFPPLHSAPLLSLPLMLVPPAPRTSRLANTFSSSPSTPTAIRNPRCQADPSGWRCPGHSIRSPHPRRTASSPWHPPCGF